MKKCIAIIALFALVVFVGPVSAAVNGTCAGCHTMHNSQDGGHMMINTAIDGTSGPGGGGYESLTRGSCIGCHTGDNGMGGTTPFVNSMSAPTVSLAGGNFYWVTENDAMGHNVKGVPGMTNDSLLSKAPGDVGHAQGCTDSCHATLFAPKDSEGNDFATGCVGCHLEPKHHAPLQATGTPALAVNGYYRFLSGHMTNDEGVIGIENSDWERTKGIDNHNEYLGKNETGTNIQNTMTNYCVGCHGNFHQQQNVGGDWIRHPSDGVLPTDGEYAAYTLYDPDVPIARPDLAAIGDSAIVRPGTDMVMCLSCHRAHGSPQPDMLRWNYTGQSTGGDGTTGCFKCHSSK